MLNVVEDRERLDSFLDKLIAMYHNESRKNLPIATCQGSAMMVAKELLGKHTTGRVITFCSNLCSAGLGKLHNRNTVKIQNTDQEKGLYSHTTEHDFYRKLG